MKSAGERPWAVPVYVVNSGQTLADLPGAHRQPSSALTGSRTVAHFRCQGPGTPADSAEMGDLSAAARPVSAVPVPAESAGSKTELRILGSNYRP